MTETPPTAQLSGAKALEEFVQKQAARLWMGYQADNGSVVGELARLRRALPRRGVMPADSWEIFAHDFPDVLRGHGDDPSRAELATASALSLLALHQQSRRERSMHQRGADHGLGRAAHTLMLRGDSGGVQRRMHALVRATSLDPVLEHLRGLVNLLRAAEIPLDYARLAADVYSVQHPERIKAVRVRWSRDFYRPIPRHTDETDPTAGDNA